MKPLPLLILLSVFVIITTSVKKEEKKPHPIVGSCCLPTWKGNVAVDGVAPDRNTYMLPEKNFISDGNAEMIQPFGRYYRWWSSIELDIPCTAEISADNVKLDWYGKSNMSVNENESDMGATLTGDKETASVICLKYDRPEYTGFRYGTKKLTNVPEVVFDVSEWATYSIEITGGTMTFYRNDKVIKQVKDSQTLGLLRKISMHFKGSGKIGWVKLYQDKKLVMEEDFEKPGKSSIKWY